MWVGRGLSEGERGDRKGGLVLAKGEGSGVWRVV